jgi:hypothetical protein
MTQMGANGIAFLGGVFFLGFFIALAGLRRSLIRPTSGLRDFSLFWSLFLRGMLAKSLQQIIYHSKIGEL